MLEQQHQNDSKPPVLLNQNNTSDIQAFTPVELEGNWSSEWNFYLDNRIVDGKTGYNVLSLFVNQNNQAVWVDRGWLVFENGQRQFHFPPVSALQNRLLGYVHYPGEFNVVTLPELKPNKLAIMPGIKMSHLVAFFKERGITLMPFVVRQTFPQSEHGLLREWRIVEFPPSRHVGYAVQWFSLSGVLLILSFIQFRKKNKVSK